MKLYFYGKLLNSRENEIGRGIISIMLPDLGVIYRTQFEGTASECEYTAALMAVKFVDNNKELLSRQRIEILTDAAELVEQINDGATLPNRHKIYRETIHMYLKKYNMSMAWVPRSENRAAALIPDLPPLKLSLNLEFDFGQKGKDSVLTGTPSSGNIFRVN